MSSPLIWENMIIRGDWKQKNPRNSFKNEAEHFSKQLTKEIYEIEVTQKLVKKSRVVDEEVEKKNGYVESLYGWLR